MEYSFKVDVDGNVIGHVNPGYFSPNEGIICVPDQAYQEDDWNWKITMTDGIPKMVHRTTGLTPIEETQQVIAQLAASNAAGTSTTKDMQTTLTQIVGSVAQVQAVVTQLASATVTKEEV